MNVRNVIFRESTYEEIILVKQIFNYFIEDSILDPLTNLKLWTKEGNILEIFAVSSNTSEILSGISNHIFSSGIPLGTIKKNRFQLEIEGAMLILPFTKKIIKIKTDQFLYGKPIFCENIIRTEFDFERNQLVIIIGKNNLHHGIGETLISSKELERCKPNTIAIKGYKNLPKDRGWYLREGN